MTDHLGYERHAAVGRRSGNSRNGMTSKTVTTEVGKVELRISRDRDGSFDPQTVRKGRRRLDGLSGSVISLYTKGMTTGDIQAHLADVYDTDISRDRISRITDAVIEDLLAWQSRPARSDLPGDLDRRDRRQDPRRPVLNGPIYVAMGVNLNGERDLLGMWVGPSGGEGAKVWAGVLTEVRKRGVNDTFIVCCDGLKGLPDAIRATWPITQTGIMVRPLPTASLQRSSGDIVNLSDPRCNTRERTESRQEVSGRPVRRSRWNVRDRAPATAARRHCRSQRARRSPRSTSNTTPAKGVDAIRAPRRAPGCTFRWGAFRCGGRQP